MFRGASGLSRARPPSPGTQVRVRSHWAAARESRLLSRAGRASAPALAGPLGRSRASVRNYARIFLDILKILEKLCPQKLNLYDYSDFTITHTSKEYKSSFHDDTPDKILSGVIYLYPDKNTGTIFSNEKNIKNSQTILWKRNKAVFFSREERKTWHAYKGDGASDRIVLVYNLYTKNIKKVIGK